MNVQTELLENHTARLTVETSNEQFEKAKKSAATKLSKKYKIPGFRQGKAPYNIVLKYLGEASVLEEAVDILGNEAYVNALVESKLNPYAPGTMEKFDIDPSPVFTFTVALAPEVKLNNYRDVRVDFELPAVTDEQVDERLEDLRQRRASSEPTNAPLKAGDRATLDVHSHFTDGEERPAGQENNPPKTYYQGDYFYHRHDAQLIADPEKDTVLEGFFKTLIEKGVSAGDEAEFELTVPDDEKYADIVGRTVHFGVTVSNIESAVIPELDDAFASSFAAEGETMTLADLREKTRADIALDSRSEYEEEYAQQVLDAILAQADVVYPPLMVEERASEMLEEFKQRLQQSRITFEQYLEMQNTTPEAILAEYEQPARDWVKRSLVLGEILNAEKITLTKAEIDMQIDMLMMYFGGANDARLRQMINSDEQRSQIANRLLYGKATLQLAKIGKGEADDVVSDGDATVSEVAVTGGEQSVLDAEADDTAQSHDDAEQSES